MDPWEVGNPMHAPNQANQIRTKYEPVHAGPPSFLPINYLLLHNFQLEATINGDHHGRPLLGRVLCRLRHARVTAPPPPRRFGHHRRSSHVVPILLIEQQQPVEAASEGRWFGRDGGGELPRGGRRCRPGSDRLSCRIVIIRVGRASAGGQVRASGQSAPSCCVDRWTTL